MIMIYTILLGIVALCAFDLMINQYQQQGEAAFLFWFAILLALAGWLVIDSIWTIVSNIRAIVAKGKAYESAHKVSIPPTPNQEQATATPPGMVKQSKSLRG